MGILLFLIRMVSLWQIVEEDIVSLTQDIHQDQKYSHAESVLTRSWFAIRLYYRYSAIDRQGWSIFKSSTYKNTRDI